MKLLLLAQQYSAATSGLGTYTRAIALGLAERGHHVTLAVPASQVGDSRVLRIIPMGFEPGNVTPFRFFRMAREFRRVLAAEQSDCDLVHFLDAREAILGGKPAVRTVGTAHDAYALDWRVRGEKDAGLVGLAAYSLWFAWLRFLERRAYRDLSLLLANSRHVESLVRSGYGVPPDRTRFVPLGLPPDLEPVPERLPGDPAVLFVGGNYLRKGLPALLRAAAALAARLPGLRVHVVGGDRRWKSFARLALGLGVADRVVFHGWQDNARVRAMMAGAGAFAMPSRVEAFGLVYLEAMRAGVPVIATRFGGAAEAFADGREALLVDPCHPEELMAAIERLHGDAALRSDLVAGGRAAASRFPVASMVEATERAYEGLLASRRAAVD